MQKALYKQVLFIIALFSAGLQSNGQVALLDTSLFTNRYYVERGFKIALKNNQLGQQYFEEASEFFARKKDTVNHLRSRIELSDLKKRAGDFVGAFDVLSEVREEAYNSHDHVVQIKLLLKYGYLFSVFGQENLALAYLKECLLIAKEFGSRQERIQPYLSLARQYISMQQYQEAKKYLDSCYLVSPYQSRLHYVDCHYAHVYSALGDNTKAGEYFKGLVPYFEEEGQAFLIQAYEYKGDFSLTREELDSAFFYWNKAIMTIDSLQAYVERKPFILEKLAEQYAEIEQSELAFQYLANSKKLSDSLFHISSNLSSKLFELRSDFQRNITKKDREIAAQKSVIISQNERDFWLKVVTALLAILAIAISITYRIRSKVKKMAYEQEKTDAILEVRNKELTANTLQMVEKERSIAELLEVIKKKAPEDYRFAVDQTESTNQKIWEDFHRRFTQTNRQFYKQLLERHPRLTQNDLKHCALIRLKFDSKEMSHILGISLHSVHMSRSRIRKKMGLVRQDSLSGYLEGV
ncbi:MAG: hypothetical protein AAF616_09475 [Bacteroidota bacterium]